MESLNGKLRDELLARELFTTLIEAKILIERWRRQYNTVRPYSALGIAHPRLRRSDRCLWEHPSSTEVSHKNWIVVGGQVNPVDSSSDLLST